MIPNSLKTALIRPLLNKTGIDSDILKNYSPVSNVTFSSKVIVKVISGRLNKHVINNNMFDPLQSAYKCKYSIETALIKVQNDILSVLDAGHQPFCGVGSLSWIRHNISRYFGVTIM